MRLHRLLLSLSVIYTKRDMYKLGRNRGWEQQRNRSLTVTPSSSAPITTPLHPSSGHSQRSCPLPSGMWMCIMEMDGGWLCRAVEQTDSSLNACLPASISLPQTAPRNRAQAPRRPAQVFACVLKTRLSYFTNSRLHIGAHLSGQIPVLEGSGAARSTCTTSSNARAIRG